MVQFVRQRYCEAGEVTACAGLGLRSTVMVDGSGSFSLWLEAQGGAPQSFSFNYCGILEGRLVTQMPRMGTHMTPMTSVTQRRKCLKVSKHPLLIRGFL